MGQSDAVPLREHLEALRAADARFQEERDRRHTEVAYERQRALAIKETADLAALELARQIQTYKDQQANGLHAQLQDERGTYATQAGLRSVEDKFVALIKPLSEYVSQNMGKSGGMQASWAVLIAVLTFALALYAVLK